LLNAGFKRFEGKGSHRKYYCFHVRVVISGKPSDEAKPYQIKEVGLALEKIKKGA
jgi:predicted RNA binding protein YcfA (HicA-like mRNA interferase family)